MRLVNLRIIQPDDFSAEGAEVRILPPARSRFVQEFTRLMEGTPAKGDGQLASRLEKALPTMPQPCKKDALPNGSHCRPMQKKRAPTTRQMMKHQRKPRRHSVPRPENARMTPPPLRSRMDVRFLQKIKQMQRVEFPPISQLAGLET